MPKRSSRRPAEGFDKWRRSLRRSLRHSDPGSALASLVITAILVLGPLPFGSVLPRERAALQVGAFLALALALISGRRLAPLARVRWPLVALVGVALVGAAQSLSWPAPLVRLVAPTLAQSWTEAARLVEGANPEPGWIPLSVAPVVSREVALHWLALAAALAAAAIQGQQRAARRLALVGLLATATFQVVYGAQLWISRRGAIWGVDVPGDPSRLRGTLVNPDHFSLLMALAVSVAAAWAWWAVRKSLDSQAEVERQALRIALPALAFGLFFVGLTFSGSRAGLLVLIAMLLAQGGLLALRYRRWQWALMAVALVGTGAAGVGLLGYERGLGRWLETSAYDITWSSRFRVWGESLDLLWGAPLTGTGLGTFRQAFPQVQPTNLPGTWSHAHNDVLELLLTVGPIGWVLLAISVVALARQAWQVFRRGRRSEDRAGGLAALGALVAAGLHSLVDFGLTIPANAFTLVILLGLVCGTPILSGGKKRQRQTFFLWDLEEEEP